MSSIIREKIDILKKEVFKMFPNAKTELQYQNDFQLLVAIIMSAQTTDKQVNKVNSEFFKILKYPKDGVKLGEEKIRDFIKTISFPNNKARNIYKTCLILENKEIPEKLEELIKLNGVGIKTAKVFLSITKNAPLLGIDTHVHRVLNRIGIVNTKSPEETDKKVEKIFNQDDTAQLHHSLIFFGRYFCTARKPRCVECPIKLVCNYYSKINKLN